jgi:hypothetical protein
MSKRTDTYGLVPFVDQRFPQIWTRFLELVGVIRFEFDERQQKVPCVLTMEDRKLRVSLKSSVRKKKNMCFGLFIFFFQRCCLIRRQLLAILVCWLILCLDSKSSKRLFGRSGIWQSKRNWLSSSRCGFQ